jgi:hypothetical protein
MIDLNGSTSMQSKWAGRVSAAFVEHRNNTENEKDVKEIL